MEFDEVIEKRHCVHSFKPKKVKFEHILEAIDASIKGPFAGNLCCLKFLIIENENTISELAKIAGQLWLNEAPALVIVCSDDTHLESQYGERGKFYARQQAGAVVNTILLKLTELGLASCWVGAFTDEILKEILKIPGHINVDAIIPVGYEKGTVKKPKKQALENVLRWENWDNLRRPSLFGESMKEEEPSVF